MSFENIMHSNPNMGSALSPYLSRYERFIFNSIPLANLTPTHLTNSSMPVEMILVVSRTANTGVVNIWNENLGAGIGIPINAGEVFTQSIDNMAWDIAEALCMAMGVKNTLPRRAFDTTQWYVIPSAATQTIDIVLGLGPSQ